MISETKSKTKFILTKITKKFTDKDSLLNTQSIIKNYDSKNRIISSNNLSFYEYDKKNKIKRIKNIYRRGNITKIINDVYAYDSLENLVAIIRDNNSKKDTLEHFKYDSKNNLIFKGNNYMQNKYLYIENRLIEKQEIENDKVVKISSYKYFKNGKIKTKDLIFGKKNKMRTYYTYYSNGKLFSERDSSFQKKYKQTEFAEFKTEYNYLKNDSLCKIINLGRVFGEKEFKIRGYNSIQYKKSNGL